MNRVVCMLILLLPAIAFAATGRASSQPASRPAALLVDYGVLASRNIFVLDRSRLQTSRPTTRPAGDEASLVLTGIGQLDDERAAFFEDVRTGQTTRVTSGQALAKGRIGAITLDGAEYKRGSAVARVVVGQNLAGEMATTMPTTSSVGEGKGGVATDAMLERLKQRRAQELRQ